MGFVFSYWMVLDEDEYGISGVDAVLNVSHEGGDMGDSAQVLAELGRIARQNGGDVAVTLPSVGGNTTYVDGVRADKWVRDGYRGLWGSSPQTVTRLAELPYGDYRQSLGLYGGSSFQQAIQDYLTGEDIAFVRLDRVGTLWRIYTSAQSKIFILLLSVCLVASVASVLIHARLNAIRRLLGYGIVRNTLNELQRAVFSPITVATAAVLIVVTLVASVMVSAPSVLSLLSTFAVVAGVLLSVIVAATVFTLCALSATDLTQALKGKLSGAIVLSGLYIMRIVVIISVVGVTSVAINYSREWIAQRTDAQHWATAKDASVLQLNGARLGQQSPADLALAAGRFRERESAGEARYAVYMDGPVFRGLGLHRDVMILNPAGADASLPAQMAEDLDLSVTDTPLVLMPNDVPVEKVRELVRGIDIPVPPVQERVYDPNGYEVLTWEVGDGGWNTRAVTVDPIVVLLPFGALPAKDRNVVAQASSGDLVFENPEVAVALWQDPELGNLVSRVNSLGNMWAKNHGQNVSATISYLASLVLAAALCVLAAGIFLMMWLSINHQRFRAALTHGKLPARDVSLLILAEVVVAVVALAYLWSLGAAGRATGPGGIAEGAASPELMAMLVVPRESWWITAGLLLLTSIPPIAYAFGPQNRSRLIRSRH